MSLASSPRFVRFWAMVAAALSILLVGAGLLGSHGVIRHEKLRDELANVRSLNQGLALENRKLRSQSRSLVDHADYIEAVIRDELGWVRRDEMVFIFPSGVGDESGSEPRGAGTPRGGGVARP